MASLQGEIISVGTEILLGDTIDTNSTYLAKELSKFGIDIYYISSVGDNRNRLKNTIKTAIDRSNLIVLTGGLGPTEDDLTKEALCDILEIPLYKNENEVSRLKRFFAKRGLEMPLNNLKQALIPEGAIVLGNSLGTASGIIIEKNNKCFILLPGPPSEMKNVFTNEVIPWLQARFGSKGTYLLSHTLKFIGISESRLDWQLQEIFRNQKNPTLGILAKNGEIHCRLTAKVSSEEEFLQIITPMKREILEKVGQHYFGSDDTKIEEIIGDLLFERGLTITTAESCTGGLIAQRITDISGSSRYFSGSVVAYDNFIKEKVLGVSTDILTSYGAVSAETALAMAKGAKKLLQTDLALAITGIAGPQGEKQGKPVGLVYISLVGENINVCEKCVFSGTRSDIRWRSANWALYLLKRSLESI